MNGQRQHERPSEPLGHAFGASGDAADLVNLERMLESRIPCDVALLASERGERARHGEAVWRLTLNPCMTVQHELTRGLICDACAAWLRRALRAHAVRECSVHGTCPRCRGDVDLVRDHSLVRL